MKLSDLTIAEVKAYCRAEDEEDEIFTVLLSAGKAYVRGQTGLTEEEMEAYEDLTVAVLILVSDLYDNRIYQQKETKITANLAVRSIIDQYCRNLIG